MKPVLVKLRSATKKAHVFKNLDVLPGPHFSVTENEVMLVLGWGNIPDNEDFGFMSPEHVRVLTSQGPGWVWAKLLAYVENNR